MSKTSGTSKLDDAKLKNRVLADSELDAVTGGIIQFADVRGNSNGSGPLSGALDAWNKLLKTYGL